ncbi:hypothetical protein E2562_015708 [Oryza meyeriana var. granulata]|uniref:Uncharacterized protein n=1 Tax=Oryza meyeriana var. granulata TaxID=110450 RepID=A0A6G1D495_9ORYZ|nr:hypothetical protein E2562_015708 [Oryza meyeriana var. granulata]
MEPEMRILRCPFTTTALRSYVTAAEAADASTNTRTTDVTATAAEEAMDGCASGGWEKGGRWRRSVAGRGGAWWPAYSAGGSGAFPQRSGHAR